MFHKFFGNFSLESNPDRAYTWIIRKARKSESLSLILRQGFFLFLNL